MALPPLAPVAMSILSEDGIILQGELRYPSQDLGARHPLAVLAHQYPSTRDSWAPLIIDLLERGVATLAFDLRGHGSSRRRVEGGSLVIDAPAGFAMSDFGAAFMSSARKVGFARIPDDIIRAASWGASQNHIDAGRILLVGASVGGSGAMLAAPRVPALAGLITFGAAGVPVHGDDAAERARKAAEGIRAPALHASSEGDPFDAAGNVRAWSEGLAQVTPVLVPGDAHAMAIYYDVRDQVLAFVERIVD